MINETVTIGLLLLLVIGLAGKKKPVFGQLTLTGELALDWLKDGSEIIAGKIMIGPCGAFPEYNVPDWASERNDMWLTTSIDPTGICRSKCHTCHVQCGRSVTSASDHK